MINTQRYFIHIDNKNVVPWTSEIENNYKFKEITLKVAMAIENGKISADEVVGQIMTQMQMKPATLEQMLDAKLKMNVREGELNLEKQVKEDNTQKDNGNAKPFDINLPSEGGGKKPADRPAGGKPRNAPANKKPAEKPPEGNAGLSSAAPDEATDDAEKVAAALDGTAGQSAGGVNV